MAEKSREGYLQVQDRLSKLSLSGDNYENATDKAATV